jgi:metal-responsive CopG/Arc/MetJ family transcriptional regulator
MGTPNPQSVRFPEDILAEIDKASILEGVDKSTFIRQCVVECLKGKKEEQPLPRLLVNQCEYLQQMIRNVGENELIKQEGERLWHIVQELNAEQ